MYPLKLKVMNRKLLTKLPLALRFGNWDKEGNVSEVEHSHCALSLR